MIHKYLFKRHEIIYFRWRVQKELQASLGLKEIRISLRTSSILVAKSRANKWFDFVNHAKLLKNAYHFAEVSKGDYIQAMKKKINKIQEQSAGNADSAYETGLINYQLGNGKSLLIDFNGDFDKEIDALAKFQQGQSERVVEDKSAGIYLSSFFEEFLVYKNTLSKKMKDSYSLCIKTLIEIMGDKDIGLIEQGDVKNALNRYLELPKRNLKKYKNFSVQELLEMEIDDEDKLAQKSVSQVKKLLQGMFAYAVEKKYVRSSIMDGLKTKFKSTTYAKYSDDEVLKILYAVNNHNHIARKWICWLAAYTGARRGEIIQLRKQDIKFDLQTKRQYLLITTDAGNLKTDNAQRRVPIHQALIDEGFLGYVETAGDRLFEGVNAETFTKWFSEFRESIGIAKYDDLNKRKVFHSFRHTFITKSRGAGVGDSLVQHVVGHEKMYFGVTSKYTHDYDLKQVLDVVDKVVFDIY